MKTKYVSSVQFLVLTRIHMVSGPETSSRRVSFAVVASSSPGGFETAFDFDAENAGIFGRTAVNFELFPQSIPGKWGHT